MSKKEKIYLRLGLFFLAVGLVITIGFGSFRFGSTSERVTETVVEIAEDSGAADESDPVCQAFQEGTISGLRIEGGYGEIHIGAGESYYVESGSDPGMVYISGETLYIDVGQAGFDAEPVYVYLPEGYQFQTAEIDVGAGYVEIMDQLTANQISVSVGAGEFYGYGLTGTESCRLTAGAGLCSASGLRTEHLEAETGVGSMDLSAEQLGTAAVSTGIGYTVLSLPGEREDYDYEITSELGDVSIDGEAIELTGKTAAEDNGRDRLIRIENGLGNTEIYFAY